jgi:Ca2+-binding RTX toxin-like protein
MIRLPLATIAALLLVPSAAFAENATVSIGGSPGSLTYAGSSQRDHIFMTKNNPPAEIFDRNGEGALMTAGSGCTDVFNNGTRIACNPVGGATINLNGGDDFFSGGFDSGFTVNGGPGNDEIIATGLGLKTLNGDDGDDTFNLALQVNLVAVNGGAGDDTFLYPSAPDMLRGGPGSDTVRFSTAAKMHLKGTEIEHVIGSDGDDQLDARDGIAETIDCGFGSDSVTADRGDVLTGCESVDLPEVVVEQPKEEEPKRDTTTVAPPPVVVVAPPAAQPVVAPARFAAKLTYGYASPLKLTSMELTGVADASVQISGKGLKTKRYTHVSGRLKLLKKRTFKSGTVITVTIAKPGYVTEVRTLTLRAKKRPVLKTLCQAPGAAKPAAC